MVKYKYSKIEIRKIDDLPGAMTGSRTEVLVDGKKLKGVTRATFDVQAGGVAKITLTMLGDLSVSGTFSKEQYELGNLFPVSMTKNKQKVKRTNKNG